MIKIVPTLHTTAVTRFRPVKLVSTQIGLCHDICIRKNTCQSASPIAQLRVTATVVRNCLKRNKTYFMKNKIIIFILIIVLSIACTNNDEIKQEPVLIKGIFKNALPMGDLRVYNHLIKTEENELGYIRVRSEPIWDINYNDNVLGTIECGIYMPAWGPTKNNPSCGVGYVIPIVDSNGDMCRGYVSLTVISEIQENYFNNGEYFHGFPEPLGFNPPSYWIE